MIPEHAALPWRDVSALLCRALGHLRWLTSLEPVLGEFVVCVRCGQVDPPGRGAP